jgi:hypothetical protein
MHKRSRLGFSRLLLALAIPLCLLTTVPISSTQTQDWQRKKTCSELGSNLQMTAGDIFTGRYPDPDKLQVSSACKQAAEAKLQSWMNDDMAEWDRLSNEACSYALGWVEKVPGTCKAGGPPPICVADHWVQRPQDAMNQWRRIKNEVRAKREAAMIREACSCYGSELNAAATSSGSYSRESSSPISSSTMALPCPANGLCPPGMSCAEGFCRILTRPESNSLRGAEWTKEKVTDAIKEKAIDELVQTISKELAHVLSSLAGKVVIGVFEAKEISLWKNSYKKAAEQLYTNGLEMQKLHLELKGIRTSGHLVQRSRETIMVDIQQLRGKLTNDVQMLTESYRGIITERELMLDKFTCPQAFEFHHRAIINAYGQLMGLPDIGVNPPYRLP